ncbi:desulfoferrodoxin [Syntrophaceticus schinkii]|jgi:superoxide reductase|uniref:Desulfoferrodoxin n=2 Tax=Syntrophaceticus schinkii TaxID=499207 RepID=A0A0B7MJP4_9FIRM|nr:Desulfoferrodoxin [Syntrophaceticus schinkii]
MMKEQVAFYRCETCGNIVELIKNGGGKLVCCGKPMAQLVANTTDASQEKHVPAVSRADGGLSVDVGSVIHPMTDKHYIEWIAVVTDNGIERVSLSPGDEPKAVFCEKPDADVYAYCNLHGLWKANG